MGKGADILLKLEEVIVEILGQEEGVLAIFSTLDT